MAAFAPLEFHEVPAGPFPGSLGHSEVALWPFSPSNALSGLVSGLTLLVVHSIPTTRFLMLKITGPRVQPWGTQRNPAASYRPWRPPLPPPCGYKEATRDVKGLVKAKINNIHCSALIPTDGLLSQKAIGQSNSTSTCLLWNSWVVKKSSRRAPVFRAAQTIVPIVPREHPIQQAINKLLMQWVSSYPVWIGYSAARNAEKR